MEVLIEASDTGRKNIPICEMNIGNEHDSMWNEHASIWNEHDSMWNEHTNMWNEHVIQGSGLATNLAVKVQTTWGQSTLLNDGL